MIRFAFILFFITSYAFAQNNDVTPKVRYLNSDEFRQHVFDYKKLGDYKFLGKKPMIIEFYADWCAPCRKIAPILKELQTEYGDEIQVFKIDVMVEKEISAYFGIQALPTIFFISNEGKISYAKGALSKDIFIEAIEKLFSIKPKNNAV